MSELRLTLGQGQGAAGSTELPLVFTNVGGTGPWFDGTIKLPTGYAVCASDEQTVVNRLLSPILSSVNQLVNDSQAPCLPLGPAAAKIVEEAGS